MQPPQVETASAPRWWTPTFMLYYIAFAIVHYYMITTAVAMGSRMAHILRYLMFYFVASTPRYDTFRYRLDTGWLFGRRIDNSDAQYGGFRNHLPVLTLLVAFHLCVSSIIKVSLNETKKRTRIWLIYTRLFNAACLWAFHGFGSLVILLILTLNYVLAKSLGRHKVAPAATWAFNIFVIFFVNYFREIRYGSVLPILSAMDSFRGLLPRWTVHFNITMLRMISFNMDYFWSFWEEVIFLKYLKLI